MRRHVNGNEKWLGFCPCLLTPAEAAVAETTTSEEEAEEAEANLVSAVAAVVIVARQRL